MSHGSRAAAGKCRKLKVTMTPISRSPVRFGLVLLGSFAGAALTLAAMGIYAVMTYIVKQLASFR
jgi:hypothetical protein